MEVFILKDLVIILGLSVLIILLFQKFKLPAILGFFITGIIVGPHGLNLIHSAEEVNLLAEIGIIFLLFIIGIEFSLKGLISSGRSVLIAGSVQVGGTIALVTLISYLLGLSIQAAVFTGFLLSLSSTAIVLKILNEKGEISSPHGRVTLAILLFQDIVVVLMMLLTPLLAGQSENPGLSILILTGKVLLIFVIIIAFARFVVPGLFRLVIKTKSRELFIMTVIVLCFATAWLTSSAGLSLALGAFFAGLVISESDYSHQATANIIPFREIFISFFFVSIGMLLDFSFLVKNIGYISIIAIAVMVLKMLVVAMAAYIIRYSPKTIILTSLALFQVGEFSFLLAIEGLKYSLLSENVYQYFLAISIISMGITPFIINSSSNFANYLLKAPLPAPVRSRLNSLSTIHSEKESKTDHDFHDHLVIIGYGVNGENLAKAARRAQIPYVVVEIDPDALQKAKSNDEPFIFGDATNEMILKHIRIQFARVIVIAISDPSATRQIVRVIRTFTETAFIIVRTRYVREVEGVIKLGADEVIPEEFETSVEIFTRVLAKYLIPADVIHGFVSEIRSHNYEILRNPSYSISSSKTMKIHIPNMEIATILVQHMNNKIIGKSIYESGLRKEYGITILAIKRGEKYITSIGSEEVIHQDDTLYLFGTPENILKVNTFLSSTY